MCCPQRKWNHHSLNPNGNSDYNEKPKPVSAETRQVNGTKTNTIKLTKYLRKVRDKWITWRRVLKQHLKNHLNFRIYLAKHLAREKKSVKHEKLSSLVCINQTSMWMRALVVFSVTNVSNVDFDLYVNNFTEFQSWVRSPSGFWCHQTNYRSRFILLIWWHFHVNEEKWNLFFWLFGESSQKVKWSLT